MIIYLMKWLNMDIWKKQKKNKKNKKIHIHRKKNLKSSKGKKTYKKNNTDDNQSNNTVSSPPPKSCNISNEILDTEEKIKRKKNKLNEAGISNEIFRIKKKKQKTFRQSCKIFSRKIIDINKKEDNNSINENNNIIKSEKNKRHKRKKKLSKLSKKSIESDSLNINSKSLIKNSKRHLTSHYIPTQFFDFQFEEEDKDKNYYDDFHLININLNQPKKENFIPNDSDIILNNYTYEEAIKYDRRPFFKIFNIFLLYKEVVFHTFFFKSPLELTSLKIFVFIFFISTNLAFNAFFYFNKNISKKYSYKDGLFFFTFCNNLNIIIFSTLVGFVLFTIFSKLIHSSNNIREVFKNEENKLKSDKNYIVSEERKEQIQNEIKEILIKFKKKIIVFFVLEIIIMLFYWYYVTAFCHVYSNTQISWILDSSLSIIFAFLTYCVLCLGYSKIYRISVDGNVKCLYRFVMFLYNFG